ncbi:hypothetical protein CFP65_5643 [Kitasatospora sp. MMS16-BH015]|uniref:hypothetical protein n=1 Tax=Kitasatospora sp. MMS16-BH015 TaxID=2018025 RepID=UPI000CA10825|nr:hypothetical protein [Kitasatospora sp. MMS16-BH015]AUG80338.1 hypothetical protein CFP65_5643 [Kitasatospora sp. MMS16-BH015]
MPSSPAADAAADRFAEPRSGRLTAWGNALLAGFAPPDNAAVAILGRDEAHRVSGLPGDAEGELHSLAWALGRLRVLGVTGLRLALPSAGHPLGLTGPAGFNGEALAAGEAVLCVGAPLGFVPEVERYGPAGDQGVRVRWRGAVVGEGPGADVASLDEAERSMADALREATLLLTKLDVAGAGPDALRALDALRRHGQDELLAPGYSGRAVRVLGSARQVAALLGIALEEHGAAVSAGEMAARREVLAPLLRTARRAQVAAYNSLVDERPR